MLVTKVKIKTQRLLIRRKCFFLKMKLCFPDIFTSRNVKDSSFKAGINQPKLSDLDPVKHLEILFSFSWIPKVWMRAVKPESVWCWNRDSWGQRQRTDTRRQRGQVERQTPADGQREDSPLQPALPGRSPSERTTWGAAAAAAVCRRRWDHGCWGGGGLAGSAPYHTHTHTHSLSR